MAKYYQFADLEFYMQRNYPSKVKEKKKTKNLSKTYKTERNHWQICPAKNVEKNSSGRRKIIWVQNMDPHKGSIEEGIR